MLPVATAPNTVVFGSGLVTTAQMARAGFLFNLLGAAIIIPTSVFAAPLGVRLAHGMPKRRLELAFAAFMAVAATRFALSLAGIG